MKIVSTVNGTPIDQLTEKEKEEFQLKVLQKIADFGYKVKKKKNVTN